MSRNKTTEEFINQAKRIHGNKYDYSLTNYINAITKVIIICPKHGEFLQSPHMHLRNINCPKCSVTYRKSTNQFINEAIKTHGNKYDYSLVEYINNASKIKIICNDHGEFHQTPQSHISNRSGCPICGDIVNGNRHKKKRDQFINEAKDIHENKYDYSLSKYINGRIKIEIICPIHGTFTQTPNSHLRGSGCPICKESKGEKQIRKLLENKNIEYVCGKTFTNCKHIRKLPFDFYLPKHNALIEFDGIQHFQLNEFFTSKTEFENLQKRDKIKTQFCNDHNINLIRIKYDEIAEDKLNIFL